MLSKIKEYFIYIKYFIIVCATTVIIGSGYMAYDTYTKNTIPAWMEGKIAAAVKQGMDIQYNSLLNKIEMQGHMIDSVNAVSSTRYLESSNWLTNLFSNERRAMDRMRDSILASIPKAVSAEFKKNKKDVVEVGITDVVIDSLVIEVKIGNSVKFVRGALTYDKENQSYRLELYKDIIEITEARGEIQDDGMLLSTVSAKSKLTGQQFPAMSTKYMVDWPSRWDWNVYGVAYAGPTLPWNNGGIGVTGGLGLDWISYGGPRYNWNILQLRANPNGLAITTQMRYKF